MADKRDLRSPLTGELTLTEWRTWREKFLSLDRSGSEPKMEEHVCCELPSLARRLAEELDASLAREALLKAKLS